MPIRLFLDIWQQFLYPCFEARRWQMRECLTTVHNHRFKSKCMMTGISRSRKCNKPWKQTFISPGHAMMFKTWQFLNCLKENHCIWKRNEATWKSIYYKIRTLWIIPNWVVFILSMIPIMHKKHNLEILTCF